MPAIVAIGEALVEIMRSERDRPLDRPAGFVGPFVGATLYAYFVSGWDWNAALICGIAHWINPGEGFVL